jgi:ferric-dicitrate binding protein FerR (iron transport regulator)
VKGDFTPCKRKKASASRTQNSRTVRQLWGNGKGNFRTDGRYASATVRGTNWLTADRCDGTQIRVRQGVVQVQDIPNRRTVTVRAGRTYLAKP